MKDEKSPTAEEIVKSIDAVLKKEYDVNTRVRFLLGLLEILDKEPQQFRSALFTVIKKLL